MVVFTSDMVGTPLVITMADGTDRAFIITQYYGSTTTVRVTGDARCSACSFAVTAITSAINGASSP